MGPDPKLRSSDRAEGPAPADVDWEVPPSSAPPATATSSRARQALDLCAGKVRQFGWLETPGRWAWHRARDARYLYRTYRATPDWRHIWGYRHHHDNGRLPPLRLRHGVVLKHGEFDNPVGLFNEIFLDRWYERASEPPPGATMLDIGANIGAVSLFWAARAPTLSIHAYEPNPSAVETLRQNIEVNNLRGRVEFFPEAVGAGTGELDLWVDIPTDFSTGYLDVSPVEGGRRIAVPMVGMEEVWSRLDQREIWLLKIDTEGAEADILEGAPRALLEATQMAIVEYHDNICPGASDRCRQVLASAGFRWEERVHPWDEGIIYASRP
jgi:FkbM family methyltransferase